MMSVTNAVSILSVLELASGVDILPFRRPPKGVISGGGQSMRIEAAFVKEVARGKAVMTMS